MDIDIKFCSDPNAFNCKQAGKIPMMIFGSAALDVDAIDISSLRLCLASNTAVCTASGPQSWTYFDRGDPTSDLGTDACAFDDVADQDGFDDLDVAFDSKEVVALIECGGLANGEASPTLVITGMTFGGLSIFSEPIGDVGIDQLMIKNK